MLQVSLYRFRMTLEESYLTRALHFSSEYKDHAPVGAAYYARGLNYRQSVLCERLFRALSREDGLAAATVDELARNETGRGPVRTAISSGCDQYDLNCLLQATAIARLASGAASCATLERMTRDSLVSVAHWGEAIHGSRGYKPMLLAATGFFPAQDFSSLAEVGRGYWTSRVHDKAHMRGSILHYVSLKYWACYSAYLWSREEYARAADVARLAVDITNGPFHRVVQTMTKPERILDHFKKISKPSSFENASEAARSALEVCHAVSY